VPQLVPAVNEVMPAAMNRMAGIVQGAGKLDAMLAINSRMPTAFRLAPRTSAI